MRRSVPLFVLGAVLVALAVAAAWLGQGMRRLPDYVARRDVAWVSAASVDREAPSTALRASAALLQRNRTSQFRRAINLYRAATIPGRDELRPTLSPADAEALIAKVLPSLHSPQEIAQTEVMLGILLAAAAGNGEGTLGYGQGTGGNLLLDQAAHHFRQAVLADPQNEEAKVDLELLLQNVARTKPPPDKTKNKGKKQNRIGQPKTRNQQRANVPRASLQHPGSGY